MIRLALFVCLAPSVFAQTAKINPTIAKVVAGISEQRVAATLRKLESFGTRHVTSAKDHKQLGIGAAQRWIHSQFSSFSPRLKVSYDTFRAERSMRLDEEVDLSNVVAVLPGTTQKDHVVLVCAHYDSVAFKGESSAHDRSHAPGVNDNGSGVAAVLELARVMSTQEFDKTVVFVAFAGEEVGLLGSEHYSKTAKQAGQKIEAVLNNDIIGSDTAGNGMKAPDRVRVFSAGPMDSHHRSLARYFKEIGERYVPEMKVDLVFRSDRLSRAGDHEPFANAGYAAVRVTTAAENYDHQHSATDVFRNVSVPYNTRVAKLNAAVLASLALAPSPPEPTRDGANDRKVARITRVGYGASMQWYQPYSPEDLAGYSIVMRPTTAAIWERELPVGEVTSYELKDVSVDEMIIGVRAWDRDGNPSLVAPFVDSDQ